MYQKDLLKLLNNEFADENCNFYDWFCSDSSLEARAKGFFSKISFLIKYKIINPKTTYVWFKNNCPVNGSLYDDMRFSLVKTAENDFIGGICPSSGHKSIKGTCEWWYFEGSLGCRTFIGGRPFKNWSAFKNEVKTNPEFLAQVQAAFWRD